MSWARVGGGALWIRGKEQISLKGRGQKDRLRKVVTTLKEWLGWTDGYPLSAREKDKESGQVIGREMGNQEKLRKLS